MEITWSAVLTVHRSMSRRRPVDESITVREPRLVQLGTEIVVIEDERGSVEQPKQQSDGPEEVGWIAALDDGEATPQACLEAEHEGGEEGVEIFEDEGRARSAGSIGSVLVELDSVEPGIGRIAWGLWADHGDPEPGVDQRQALEPHASVEWDRQVLHEDEDPSRFAETRFCRSLSSRALRPLDRLRGTGVDHHENPS